MPALSNAKHEWFAFVGAGFLAALREEWMRHHFPTVHKGRHPLLWRMISASA